MAENKDLYAILGVSKSADEDEIKAAYKKLVRQYHPDLNPGDEKAEEKFKEVAVAFEVLGDKKKRQLYDDFGMAGLRPGFNEEQARAYQQWGGFGGGSPFGGGGGFGGEGFDLGSIFEQFFGGQQQPGGPRPTGPSRGQDIEQKVPVSFLEAVLGCEKEISLTRPVHCEPCKGSGSSSGRTSRCPSCGGSGRIQQQSGFFASTQICPSCGGTGEAITDPCDTCRGSGLQHKTTTLTVTLPPGITDDSRIRLSGKGAAGKRKGPSGDLFLSPRIDEHPYFTRDGRDVHLQVPLTAYEAYTGANVDVPTPTGTVGLRIPARAQSGQKLRLRGKGVAATKKRPAGDLIVTLIVRLPTEDSPQAAELLQALQEFYPDDLRQEFA